MDSCFDTYIQIIEKAKILHSKFKSDCTLDGEYCARRNEILLKARDVCNVVKTFPLVHSGGSA